MSNTAYTFLLLYLKGRYPITERKLDYSDKLCSQEICAGSYSTVMLSPGAYKLFDYLFQFFIKGTKADLCIVFHSYFSTFLKMRTVIFLFPALQNFIIFHEVYKVSASH